MPFITDRANGTIAEGIIPLKRPSVMYHGNDDATTCKPIRFRRAICRRRCDAGEYEGGLFSQFISALCIPGLFQWSRGYD